MRIFKLIARTLFSRIILVTISLLVQIFIMYLLFSVGKHIVLIFGGFTLLSFIIVLSIVNSRRNSSYKIVWIILLLLFPGIGVFFYILYKLQFSIRKMKRKLDVETNISSKYLIQDRVLLNNIKNNNRELYNLAYYINNVSSYKIYDNCNVKYYDSGLSIYKDLLESLKSAKKYIFMEFFIIDKGYMLNNIVNILKDKVKEGVEVRIMYDGFGSLFSMHKDFNDEMENYGIKCCVFSPLKPVISFHYNYRDHRKLCIIDGNIAYTGGFNIADEYINMKQRFGYWKDGGIKLVGDVVDSYVVMFLELWNINNNNNIEYEKYISRNKNIFKNNGYVIGFGENPLSDFRLSKSIYLDIINNAKYYVYIMTPYLILDDDILFALTYASKRGVDVKIFMPSIPDKKLVYYLGRSFYYDLIEDGVEIYEFNLGFNHSKIFLSDDIKAVVGTINLDYRSLYMHFECGCYIYDRNVVKEIRNDFLKTKKNSKKLSIDDIKKYNVFKRLIGKVLRFLAPLI